MKELPQKKKMEVSRDVDSALYVQPGLERRSGTQIVPMESVPFGGKEPVLSTQCQSVIGHWLSPYIPGQWRGGVPNLHGQGKGRYEPLTSNIHSSWEVGMGEPASKIAPTSKM